MTKRKHKKTKKILESVVLTMSMIFILWFLLSWGDVVADNTSENPQHSEYNMFVLMTNYLEEQD